VTKTLKISLGEDKLYPPQTEYYIKISSVEIFSGNEHSLNMQIFDTSENYNIEEYTTYFKT